MDIISEYCKIEHEKLDQNTPWLWSVKGELFAEIDAIKQLAKIEVISYGPGGAVSLLLSDSDVEVNKALIVVKSVQGEPIYLK